MKQRDDIDPRWTWVISDTHFGHSNIVEYQHRPPDFEQLLLENIAREVPEGENVTLLHLGDLSYSNNARFKAVTSRYITPRTGRKVLVPGNHDKSRASFYYQSGFKRISPFWIPYYDWRVSFSHYPWNSANEGPMPPMNLRVHGHTHADGYSRSIFTPYLKNHVNVSVEVLKYKPVNLLALLEAVIDGRYQGTMGEVLSADAVQKPTPHVAPLERNR